MPLLLRNRLSKLLGTGCRDICSASKHATELHATHDSGSVDPTVDITLMLVPPKINASHLSKAEQRVVMPAMCWLHLAVLIKASCTLPGVLFCTAVPDYNKNWKNTRLAGCSVNPRFDDHLKWRYEEVKCFAPPSRSRP